MACIDTLVQIVSRQIPNAPESYLSGPVDMSQAPQVTLERETDWSAEQRAMEFRAREGESVGGESETTGNKDVEGGKAVELHEELVEESEEEEQDWAWN
jgi:hypothetical protein